jgi:hypothetical protein
MLADRCRLPYNYLVIFAFRGSMPLAFPVAVPPAAAPATALPSAAATTPAATLLGPIAALAVDRPVPAGFEGHRRGLSTTGTDHGSARAHAGAGASAGAVTTFVLGMGRGVTPAAGALFSLAAWFAAPGRGVTAFLEKLLFTSGENKFLTAVATGK